jgi:hypothetical protein
MMGKRNFEFGFMTRRERIKLELIKTMSLAFVAWCLWSLVFHDLSVSSRLTYASGSLAFSVFYLNMLRVKSEVIELFEPPYNFKGLGMIWLGFVFSLMSTYYTLQGE